MARPRTIKLPGGAEVILKDVSAEDREKIEKALAAPTEKEPVKAEEPAGDYNSFAVGVYEQAKEYHVIVFRFDPNTMTVVTEKDEAVGRSASFAADKFKIAAVDCGLV